MAIRSVSLALSVPFLFVMLLAGVDAVPSRDLLTRPHPTSCKDSDCPALGSWYKRTKIPSGPCIKEPKCYCDNNCGGRSRKHGFCLTSCGKPGVSCYYEYKNKHTVCRAATGLCDKEERCTGDYAECPADKVFRAGKVCRRAAGRCDKPEVCDGHSKECPTDTYIPASDNKVCRPAKGACDVAETCSGKSVNCPEDGYKPADTECRPAEGKCDLAETCTGKSKDCPEDGYKPAETECRPAEGKCDVAESCTGKSKDCPEDKVYQPEDHVECRGALGPCDKPEYCDGSGVNCPDEEYKCYAEGGANPSDFGTCPPASAPHKLF